MTQKIFFTSDTHFGSQAHLTHLHRPFRSIQEMDFEMIVNWNLKVPKDGLVYHLGDWGEFFLKESLPYISLLNGEIILLEGNHDRNDAFRQHHSYFKKIIKNNEFLSLDGESFKLVHEPLQANYQDDEFVLFGHITGQTFKRNGLNVCVDSHSFTPISAEEVLDFRNLILNKLDENVFCDLSKGDD